ncbi:hypothetical protein D9M68_844570 [compost metagenome]
MLMGILCGWHEAGDKTRNGWASGGSWRFHGRPVKGYGVILDGRLTEVVDPRIEDAIGVATSKVIGHCREFGQPWRISAVAYAMMQAKVVDSAPDPFGVVGSGVRIERATLEQIEGFLSGFEDDDEQEGVVEMLAEVRQALGIKP